MPTYNEALRLEPLVEAICSQDEPPDVLVVDDSSPDGTGILADKLAGAFDGVHVLHRDSKQGLGSAYRDGFAAVLDAGYTSIAQMDADGSHDPRDLVELFRVAETGAVAIGSRYVPGGSTEGWTASRRRISRYANVYVRALCRVGVRDATSGFRAWPAAALPDIGVASTRSTGYAFQIETALRALASGWSVKEIPITFVERAAGRSKFGAAIVWEAFSWITAQGIRRGFRRTRRLLRRSEVFVAER